jgi:hypothetical protein
MVEKTYEEYLTKERKERQERQEEKREEKGEEKKRGEEKNVHVWKDTENYSVYVATDVSGDLDDDDDDADERLEIRVLWELEVDDPVHQGGTGWTTVLVIKYRHDDTPHGSVEIGTDDTSPPLGWIELMANDSRLIQNLDEDSEELYSTVANGMEEDRTRGMTVKMLQPIQEEDDDDEIGEVEGVESGEGESDALQHKENLNEETTARKEEKEEKWEEEEEEEKLGKMAQEKEAKKSAKKKMILEKKIAKKKAKELGITYNEYVALQAKKREDDTTLPESENAVEEINLSKKEKMALLKVQKEKIAQEKIAKKAAKKKNDFGEKNCQEESKRVRYNIQ